MLSKNYSFSLWAAAALAAALFVTGCRRPANPPGSGDSAELAKPTASPNPATVNTIVPNAPAFGVPKATAESSADRFRNGTDADRIKIAGHLLNAGTDDAFVLLLTLVHEIRPGSARTAICERLSKMDTTGRRDELLNCMADADMDVAEALSKALGAQADGETISAVVDRYQKSSDPRLKERLCQIIAESVNSEAVGNLAALIPSAASLGTDPLAKAATGALTRNASGAAVDQLLRVAGTSADAGNTELLKRIIGSISSPEAYQAFLSNARGNKESGNATRLIAIEALRNYPTEETLALMNELANSSNPEIQAAAKSNADRCSAIIGQPGKK